MPRGNGSLIGIDATPNANVASGIWTVREAETLLRANKWPATPTVPGAPTGTPGNGQVALTWTAPTGGSTVTDYIVQYSSNAGSTWTTFSDGVSTATSATVTGLTNGTGYIFRIQAVNALGEGPAGSASGTITPFVISASLLLHFDGTNGSTTFTDSSANSIAVTAYGNAEISTAESVFGGASGYFDGTALTNLETEASAELELGSGDFTIEFWVYDTDLSYEHYWLRTDAGTAQEGVLIGVGGGLLASSNGGAWDIINAGDVFVDNGLLENTWHHIAVTRSADTWRAFLDGVKIFEGTGEGAVFQPSQTFRIGSSNPIDQLLSGFLDEFRFVKGTAVYTANFTPPTAPF